VNRREFEAIRDLPGKEVNVDIQFQTNRSTDPNLTFKDVPVENNLGYAIRLNGTYKPDVPSVTYNFFIPDVGPICRIDVNGPIHKPVGRTHKHSLKADDDPRRNLPSPDAAPDFEGKSPREVWELLCQRANIVHTGQFIDP
jgi:hypothetical protein